MRQLLLIATTMVLTAASAGCAARLNAGSHVERGLDFSRYRTFDWGTPDALPAGDPRFDRDPFFTDRLLGSVEKQLGRHGLELATGVPPDLLIHYHANVRTRLQVRGMASRYASCAGVQCGPDVVDREAATFVIDIIDARSSRLVWRGWVERDVSDLLNDRGRMARVIDESMTQLLRQLPPAS